MSQQSSSSKPAFVLHQGDCLDFLRTLPDAHIDLIYVDPPYFTNRRYEKHKNLKVNNLRQSIGVSTAPVYSFDDRWAGGHKDYLGFLEPRLREMHRVLKPGGVFLLHLDWHIVHYAKVLCDQIFGADSFQNELIWYYQTGGASRGRFSRKHDTILFYSRGKTHYFDGRAIAIPRTEKSLRRARSGRGARIATDDMLKNPDDVLTVPALNAMSRERTGYPTQKPSALLEQLIVALCPPGGTVADFFCGSGTTLVAAGRLGRVAIGCDISPQAIRLAAARISSL